MLAEISEMDKKATTENQISGDQRNGIYDINKMPDCTLRRESHIAVYIKYIMQWMCMEMKSGNNGFS